MGEERGSVATTRTRTSREEDAHSVAATLTTSHSLEGKSSNKTRLIERDMPMNQSRGIFAVQKHRVSENLLLRDAFHMILRQSTWRLIVGCFALYMAVWLLFAAWWLQVAQPCGISLTTYRQALYLSMETMTTIGYGVDDPFFQDCSEAMPLLFIQSFLGMVLDVTIIGILFQRFSRANPRAATIIFSEAALLRQRGSRIQLAFRIAEMQAASLLQVSLQVFVLMHRQDIGAEGCPRATERELDDLETVIVKALPLQELDDTNNVLLCGLPMTITHTIDRFSPLAPCNAPWLKPDSTNAADPTKLEVRQHLEDLPYVEIVAVISGVEEITGASVEGRQSYTLKDIRVSHEFSRCVYLDSAGKHCTDFGRFHQSRPGQYKVSI